MPATPVIHAPAGQRTILHRVNQGSIPFDLDFTVEPEQPGQALAGQLEISASSWIIPNAPKLLPLQARHVVSRGYWNTFFTLTIIPQVDVVVTRRDGKFNGTRAKSRPGLVIFLIAVILLIMAFIVYLSGR